MKLTAKKVRRPARPSVRSRPLEGPTNHPVTVYDHPPRVGSPSAPVCTFRVVSDQARLDSVHQGRGLTLEDVIAHLTRDFAGMEGGKPGSPSDLTVYRGELVAAVVRWLGDGKGGYEVLPVGGRSARPAVDPPPRPAHRPRPGPRDFDRPTAEARPLAMSVCRQAAADWKEALAREREAYRRYNASEANKAGGRYEEAREWERWLGTLVCFRADAEARVSACVLTVHGLVDHPRDIAGLRWGWCPVQLQLGREYYVVTPGDEGDPRPRLTVVDDRDFDSCQFGQGEWD